MSKHNTLARLSLATLAMTAVALSPGCGDDGDVTEQPSPNGGGGNGGGGTTNPETAWLVGFRTEGPEGRTNYMTVEETIPSEPDFDTVVELGMGQVQIRDFNGVPYTYNEEQAELTRWNVDRHDLSLSPGPTLSLTGVGVTGNIGLPVFFSDTQAFFFPLRAGAIIEFNPTAMEIVQVIDVEPLVYEGVLNGMPASPDGVFYTVFNAYVSGERVLLPIIAGDRENWTLQGEAEIAVFTPATGELVYHEDDRLAGSRHTLHVDPEGRFYQATHPYLSAALEYGEHVVTSLGSLGGLLRVQPDGTYDPDFLVDLMGVLDAKTINSVPFFLPDGRALVSYLPSTVEWPADPQDMFNTPPSTAAVDLETGAWEAFDAFDGFMFFGLEGIFDGTNYLFAAERASDGSIDGLLLRQDGPTEATRLFSVTGGEFRHLGGLW